MGLKQFVVVTSCVRYSGRNEKADISILKNYEKAGKQISDHLSFSNNTKMSTLNGEDTWYEVGCEVQVSNF